MKKFISFCFFMVLTAATVFAQDEQSGRGNETPDNVRDMKFKDRLFYGGNFSLQLGNITLIDVSPLVGYRITNQLQVAGGITYQYLSFRNISGVPAIGSSIYGGRAFGRYFVVPSMFLQAEYESLSLYRTDLFTGERKRQWVPAAFVGGGYSQRMGQRAAFVITILYNTIWNQNTSAYASPWVVRAGIQL